jgi:hypothetical protein
MGRETTKDDLRKVIKELKVIVEGMNGVFEKYYVK